MAEGSLEAPTRHPIAWRDPDFYDEAKLDDEMRRIFDICHGCRRCFNLCDSFPRLFDLIDEAESGELDTVASADFKPVVDACTLCDMCFLTKCPYVPPQEFNLDFPHLMLRYRAVEHKKGETPWSERQLTETDRNGALARPVAGLCNWASNEKNGLTRPLMEKALGVHRDAKLPAYHSRTLTARAAEAPEVNAAAPAFGRKALLYATCFANFNNPDIGIAARRVLAHNGVETEIVYPSCCGMPQLEHGDVARVAETAVKVAAELRPRVDEGYTVIGLVPSCVLMLKFEWPLLVPDDENVAALAAATRDVDEYIVGIARKEGLADGLKPLDGGVVLHIACHSRAQNIGQKSTELLKLIPQADLKVIERCSGHGGAWGVRKENFEVALKVGKPVARQAREAARQYVASGCPLAADHILQGMERVDGEAALPTGTHHPIELFARAYGF
jgi:glycerol-3-phosphate dehydrogenase subunit C